MPAIDDDKHFNAKMLTSDDDKKETSDYKDSKMSANAKIPAEDNTVGKIIILDTSQILHHPPKAYPNHNPLENQLKAKLMNENHSNNNNGDDNQKDDVNLKMPNKGGDIVLDSDVQVSETETEISEEDHRNAKLSSYNDHNEQKDIESEDNRENDVDSHKDIDSHNGIHSHKDIDSDQHVDSQKDIDSEDDKDVDSEDDKEVDSENDREVDSEDDKDVDSENDKEVDSEDNSEVMSRDISLYLSGGDFQY